MPRLHAPVLLPTTGSRGFGGAVFLSLAAMLAVMACFKYLALHSTISGLGLRLSDLYSIHTDGAWWRAFTGHARPLLLPFALVYRLVPDQAAPFVLLTVQALFLALPALVAARRYGLLAALAYGLYFPVWTNAVNGFHLQHLLIPILFGFLVAASCERFGLAAWLGLLPALVGEYYALTTICCGLYLWTVHHRRRAGLLLLLGGAAYLYAMVSWIVPFCTATALSPSLAALLASWTGSAEATIQGIGWGRLLVCCGALLFFPLFRPKALLPALPGLLLILLAGPETEGLAGPVTTGLAGVFFFSFCEVLGPVRVLAGHSGAGGRRFGWVVFLGLAVVHVLVSPSPVSRLFLTGASFDFGLEAYEPTARDAAILAEILRSVPDDDAVPVAAQNTLNWGALAERRHFGSFPQGVSGPQTERDLSATTWKDFLAYLRSGRQIRPPERQWQAQYVLLDTTRPWAVLDRECLAQDKARDARLAREYTDLVVRARRELETVSDQDGFLILRRRPPTPPAVPTAPTATGEKTPPATATPVFEAGTPAPAQVLGNGAASGAAPAPHQPGETGNRSETP